MDGHDVMVSFLKEDTTFEEAESKAKETMLVIAGFTKQEIERDDMLTMGAEELCRIVRERMLDGSAGNGNRQMVANKDQIELLIKKGWEFVALVDDKVILKLPDSK